MSRTTPTRGTVLRARERRIAASFEHRGNEPTDEAASHRVFSPASIRQRVAAM
jgi:hypothetical protein